ncbi:MAG TPA: hypothetical protein VNV85_04090 [Puia sp.]|jgi:hypothetical protein|nr:hypothetical protein [Puia sp.]
MRKLIAYFLVCTVPSHSCFTQDSLQYLKGARLHIRAVVTTDSGIQRGYLWQVTDSAILLSNKKRIMGNAIASPSFYIPAENISVLTVKNNRFPFAEMAGGAVLGFVLTAGLWENEDLNDDGHLSFWELLFGAIDGTSSRNRERRKVALWVGVGGGVAGLLAGALSGRKLTISFPIGNRRNVLKNNHFNIEQFIR